MAKGRKAKPIHVESECPHCGKVFVADIVRVVDTPAEPAEAHWQVDIRKGSGGLYEGVEGETKGDGDGE